MAYILRALDSEGNESFYTGRAGRQWVDANIYESFVYGSKEVAQSQAAKHNKLTAIHGLRFIALEMPV